MKKLLSKIFYKFLEQQYINTRQQLLINLWILLKIVCDYYNPVDTGRKLNVQKTFRRRPGRLLNVFCTFNLSLVSTGKESAEFPLH